MAIPAEAVGAFGDIGGNVNTMLRWSPDPDDVAAALVSVAGYLDNLRPPLLASRRVVQQDIQERFDTQTDPEGNAWAPLSESYLEWKASVGANTDILRLFGPLEEGATAPTTFVIDEHEGQLYFDTGNLPDYWAVHQVGTRTSAGVAAELSRRAAAVLGLEEEDEGTGAGRGLNTPARPYIGVSADAEDRIFNIFDIWFFEGMQVKVSSAGVVQHSPGGRFGAPVDI